MTGHDGEKGLRQACRLSPTEDLVLTEMRMPGTKSADTACGAEIDKLVERTCCHLHCNVASNQPVKARALALGRRPAG
jgi:hypothetical protein